MRVGVTTLLSALALFALANIQRARHPAEPTVDFVVWDTEQTSWEGSNARRWSGLIPGTQKRETREVLQLSALRATLVPHDRAGWTLRHGEAFSLLVRPTVNPVRQTTRPCPCPCPCLQAATIGLQAATLPFQAAIVRLQAVIHSSPGRDPWAFRLPPSRVHALAVPRRTQVLSSYVTDLTGISQLELNRSGVPFAEAMGRTPRVARTPGPEARALTLPDLLRLATRYSLLATRYSPLTRAAPAAGRPARLCGGRRALLMGERLERRAGEPRSPAAAAALAPSLAPSLTLALTPSLTRPTTICCSSRCRGRNGPRTCSTCAPSSRPQVLPSYHPMPITPVPSLRGRRRVHGMCMACARRVLCYSSRHIRRSCRASITYGCRPQPERPE